MASSWLMISAGLVLHCHKLWKAPSCFHWSLFGLFITSTLRLHLFPAILFFFPAPSGIFIFSGWPQEAAEWSTGLKGFEVAVQRVPSQRSLHVCRHIQWSLAKYFPNVQASPLQLVRYERRGCLHRVCARHAGASSQLCRPLAAMYVV